MTDSNWDTVREEFLGALLKADSDKAVSIAKESLAGGASPTDFFEQCISPALTEVGNRFETLDIFLPEMVEAAEVVNRVNDEVITPAVEANAAAGNSGDQIASKGKVVLATIKGDLHDIGKSMVALILRVNGFEVIDMGINVPPADIADLAEREGADIIGMSSLLTTCLPYMKDLVDYLEGRGVRDQ